MKTHHWNALTAIAVGAIAVYGVVSLPVVHHPLGSDWGHYFTAAEYIWNPVDGIAYPDFRKPWFGWVLGGVGQKLGYFDAARALGVASLVVMVGSAGLLATALANRWAGVVAACCVVLMPLVMDGVLWVNHYPLLSAAVGLAFAAGAAANRWPSMVWVGLAAFAGGAAWALDIRGGVGIGVATGLVALSALRHTWRGAAIRMGVFGGIVMAVLAHDRWLQDAFDVPQLAFEQQLSVQRKGTIEQIGQGLFDDPALEAACREAKVTKFQLHEVGTPCAEKLRDASYRRMAADRHLPRWPTALIAVFGLIPWRDPKGDRGRMLRSTIGSAAVGGAVVVSLWIGMSWVTYFDRYAMPLAVALAVLVPVGAARFASWIPRCPSWVPALVAGAWVFSVEPGWGARQLDAPEKARSSEFHAGELARWARDTVQPGDRVLDCAGLAVDSLLLPNRIDYTRFPPGDPQCVTLLRAPPATAGTFYLITMHRDIPPHMSASALPFNADAVARSGYVSVEHSLTLEGFRLWRLK